MLKSFITAVLYVAVGAFLLAVAMPIEILREIKNRKGEK